MSVLGMMNSAARMPGRDNRIYGVVTAIVRDIRDPEGLGRIKLDFPWLAEENDEVASASGEHRSHSYWARIATLMAGGGRGSFFIPEVGDEVLVAFEQGNINYPFVLGCLWNRDDPPPRTMDDDRKNHVRSLRTRSGHVLEFDDNTDEKAAAIRITSQGGHSLVIDDSGGTGRISLRTAAGHEISLDDEAGTVTLADHGGNSLSLDAGAGTLTVQTNGDQTLSGQGSITIEALSGVTIKAPGGITLDSTSVTLGTGASMALVNETFLNLFNTHMHVGNMGAPTSPPVVPAVPGVQTTIFTKGA
ncbi:phage baseplate assembly protein V [Desulfatiferula olefinivorans]